MNVRETHPSNQVGIGVRGPDVVVFVTFDAGDEICAEKIMMHYQYNVLHNDNIKILFLNMIYIIAGCQRCLKKYMLL